VEGHDPSLPSHGRLGGGGTGPSLPAVYAGATVPEEAALTTRLVQADRDQARIRDRATYAAWGQPASLDGYLEFEDRLRDHPWGRERSAQWQLRSEQDEVLCSCETYRMTSRIGTGPATGHAYGVASVFTDQSLRGHGHAADLLGRVAAAVAAVDPRAQAMVLFSDVAPEIYARMGYAARPAFELVFDPLAGNPGAGVDRLLDEAGAAAALASAPYPPGPFAIRPEPGQLDWQLERERLLCAQFRRPRPEAWGAVAGAGFALWCASPFRNALLVLVLHAPVPEAAAALVAAARRTAHGAGLARVVLWEDPLRWPDLGARVEDRTPRLDAIPMIRPLDPRVAPDAWVWIPRVLWL
jgi:hypothetical protein